MRFDVKWQKQQAGVLWEYVKKKIETDPKYRTRQSFVFLIMIPGWSRVWRRRRGRGTPRILRWRRRTRRSRGNRCVNAEFWPLQDNRRWTRTWRRAYIQTTPKAVRFGCRTSNCFKIPAAMKQQRHYAWNGRFVYSIFHHIPLCSPQTFSQLTFS